MRRWWMMAVLAGAALATDKKVPPWEKSRYLGQDLYRENCVVCHDIDKKESKKFGPSLHHLFKNDKLPLTGGKPSRDYVTVKVKFGGQLMPPFIKRMTDPEIAALVDYIESK